MNFTTEDYQRQVIVRNIISLCDIDIDFVLWIFGECKLIKTTTGCVFKWNECLWSPTELMKAYKKINNL